VVEQSTDLLLTSAVFVVVVNVAQKPLDRKVDAVHELTQIFIIL